MMHLFPFLFTPGSIIDKSKNEQRLNKLKICLVKDKHCSWNKDFFFPSTTPTRKKRNQSRPIPNKMQAQRRTVVFFSSSKIYHVPFKGGLSILLNVFKNTIRVYSQEELRSK